MLHGLAPLPARATAFLRQFAALSPFPASSSFVQPFSRTPCQGVTLLFPSCARLSQANPFLPTISGLTNAASTLGGKSQGGQSCEGQSGSSHRVRVKRWSQNRGETMENPVR